MAHPRQNIRAAVKALLLDRTSAESRVYLSREVPLRHGELPALEVYSEDEDSSLATLDGALTRKLQVVVYAVVTATEAVDDELDDRALEVEAAMAADPTLGGAALTSHLASTRTQVIDGQERPLGVAQLTYDVTYYTPAPT